MYRIDIKETASELITFVVAGALIDEAAADLQRLVNEYRDDAIAMAVDLREVHRSSDKAIETLIALRRAGMELQRVPAYIEYWMNAIQNRGRVSRTLIAAAVLVLAFVVSLRAEEPMTLDQAVAEALEHNRAVNNVSLEVDKAEAQIAAARSERYPQTQLSMISSKSLSNIELETESGEKLSQGSALKSDLLQVKARAASPEYEALVLRNRRADAVRQLNNLLGRQPDGEIVLAALPLPTGSTYQQPTIDNRPDLRESEARIRQAELDLRIERGDFIPKASLQVTSATTSSINALHNTFSSAALVVRWEPFTWGRRKAEIAQKKHTIQQARNSRDDCARTRRSKSAAQ